jgi:hypothetical protein
MSARTISMAIALTVALFVSSTATLEGGQNRVSLSAPLTAQDIHQSDARDALGIVQRLRPLWLHPRGGSGLSTPVRVYLDGLPLGDVSELRSISASAMSGISYIPGIEAVGRWGPRHSSGVIMVHSR